MALSKEPPYDIGVKRSLSDPRDQCTQWLSKDEFNRVAKFGMSHNFTITCHRSKKDLGTHNQQRIAVLSSTKRPSLEWAPDNHQTTGEVRLLRTNAQYETKAGEWKRSITYEPGHPDT